MIQKKNIISKLGIGFSLKVKQKQSVYSQNYFGRSFGVFNDEWVIGDAHENSSYVNLSGMLLLV